MHSILLLLVLALLMLSTIVVAVKPAATEVVVGPSNNKATVTIPSRAVEVTPGVFYLGSAVHNGETVQGFAFVDYRESPVKPGTRCGNGVCDPGETAKKCPADCGGSSSEEDNSCYGFLAKGAKWKTSEPYVVNPENTSGLGLDFVADNIALDIAKWEEAASSDILGEGLTTTETLVADTVSPDNVNEVYFGSIAEPGAIAITIVWGIFTGAPGQRRLVEWDQVYDQVDYAWSSSGEAGKMDFENIATHELGHSVGLDDLYTAECSEQTMYGYAGFGETKKQSLEAGDTTGIKTLYAS